MPRHLEGFVDLHSHSHFSILDGFPKPDEMVDKAVALGRPALALTDHGSMSGHVLFEKAVEGFIQKQIGADTLKIRTGNRLDIKPIFGLEAYIVTSHKLKERSKNHITLLAMNPTGYRNLIQIVTRAHSEGFYYRAAADLRTLADHSEGVLCLTGCESSILMKAIHAGDGERALEYVRILKTIYGEHLYVELQHFPHSQHLQSLAYQLAQEQGIPHVLTCDCHYLDPTDQPAHQFIMAVRDRCSISEAFSMSHAMPLDPEDLLRGVQHLNPQVDWIRAMEHVADVVDKIGDYKLPHAPHVIFPYDGDKVRYIRERCLQFLRDQGLDNDEYLSRLDLELKVIADKGYEDYFLVVDDIIGWSKKQGIMVGPGRGSAASSVICWGLGITTVDPLRWGLLFERFVDPTRTDLPDIDIDFEDDRRGEIFEYVRGKYGEDNVASIATFATFGGKNTLQDAARAYNIPYSAIDTIVRYLPERSSGDQRASLTIQDALAEPDVAEVFRLYPELEIASKVQGRIRHVGKHAAGVVVTSEPISNYAPIIQAPSTKERLLGLDWRDAAYLNLMKIDILGLKELTMVRLAAERVGMTLDDIYNIPLDDPAAIQVFNDRDYLGIFQYDGQAVRSVAGRITFDGLQAIADVNALARPGPLHAGATEAYIRGRETGIPNPVIKNLTVQPLLEKTYGQIIYQETVMRILREVGGLDWQSVCDIRQIMGKSKGSEMVDSFYPAWEAGCLERGVSPEDVKQIWETIRLYGKHAFNVAHAVVYGLLAYWGAYMKAHHPTEFYWSHLVKAADESVEARYIHEAQRRGIEFGKLDLRVGSEKWDIVDGKIVPGWSQVPGVGPTAAAELIKHAPFESLDDLRERVNKRKVNSARVVAIEEYMTLSVDQIYNLHIWNLYPERAQMKDLQPGFQGYILGRVMRINKKSRREEALTKGKPPPTEGPDEYAVFNMQDDTSTVYAWISADKYLQWHDLIWSCKDQYVLINGHCFGDSGSVIAVKSLQIVDPNPVESNNELDELYSFVV